MTTRHTYAMRLATARWRAENRVGRRRQAFMTAVMHSDDAQTPWTLLDEAESLLYRLTDVAPNGRFER